MFLPENLERRALDAVRRHALEGQLASAASTVGLGPEEFSALCTSVGLGESRDAVLEIGETRSPFLSPLIAMLWAHRATDAPWTRLMAGTVASACLGARHLWQDIGLKGRVEVSAVMGRHFPTLAEGNTRNLKWKHYLFLRLGEELGMADLRPPRCDGCEDFHVCFPLPPSGVEIHLRSIHDGPTKEEKRSA